MRVSSSLFALLFAGSGVACATEGPPPVSPTRAIATCGSEEDCAHAVANDPTDPHLRLRWAATLEEASKATMAAREFRGVIRLADDESDPIEEAARGLIRLGDPQGCLAVIDEQLGGATRNPGLANVLQRARQQCAAAAKKP